MIKSTHRKSKITAKKTDKTKSVRKTLDKNDAFAVALLANSLMSFFGDQGNDEGIAQIKEAIKTYSGTKLAFQRGLDLVISDPKFDCARLVRDCANRRAESQAEGRAWLKRLKEDLFS